MALQIEVLRFADIWHRRLSSLLSGRCDTVMRSCRCTIGEIVNEDYSMLLLLSVRFTHRTKIHAHTGAR